MIGVVLAGGAARRMGGTKAGAQLGGRSLGAWAVEALRAAGLADVVVVAKPETALPPVGAAVWREPAEPRHPLAGIRFALERAGGVVVTLPVDLPLVGPEVLRTLARVDAPCAVVRAGGRVQPLVGRFGPEALARLPVAGRATDAVLALGPIVVDVPADGFLNVNTAAELEAAAALVARRPRA